MTDHPWLALTAPYALTGTRSTVYASAGDAVNALRALGITPVSDGDECR